MAAWTSQRTPSATPEGVSPPRATCRRLGSLAQQGGELVSQGSLDLRADTLDNSQSGLIAANGGIAIEARQVDNRAGEISSTSKVAVNAREQLDNRGGKVIGDSGLRTVQRLLNQAKGFWPGATA